MKLYIDVKDVTGDPRKIYYSGYFNVSRVVQGPLEFTFDISRCDVSMEKCENYPSLKVPSFCQKLKDKKAFYFDSIRNIHPPIECPIKPQKYVASNSSIDLSAFAFIPITNSRWILMSKILSGKNREMVLCSTSEYQIVRARRKIRH